VSTIGERAALATFGPLAVSCPHAMGKREWPRPAGGQATLYNVFGPDIGMMINWMRTAQQGPQAVPPPIKELQQWQKVAMSNPAGEPFLLSRPIARDGMFGGVILPLYFEVSGAYTAIWKQAVKMGKGGQDPLAFASTKLFNDTVKHLQDDSGVWNWGRTNGDILDYSVECTMKTFTIRVNGDTIRVAADHPFSVEGKGWIAAKDLDVGDRIRWRGVEAAVEAITDGGEAMGFREAMAALARKAPRMGHGIVGFTAGPPIPTVDGPKKVEDIKPGDYIITRDPFDPERN
jgi:hypothetical protein